MKKIISIITVLIFIFSMMTVSVFSASDESGIIMLMNEIGVMSGDPDGNLRLEDTVSRAEFTKMVVNASEYKNLVALNQPTTTFKDVSYRHWAAPYIRTGITKGVLSGYTDGTFKPDNNVLYEEALNICLKLLGYTAEDFGTSWPSGQVGLSMNLGLTKNLSSSVGQNITRRDAMNVIYNMLNTHTKGTKNYYITKINYELVEDVVLIATNNEDVSVGSDKMYTSGGTFKITESFDTSNVGRKGTLVVKNSNEAVGFIPSSQIEKQYNLYQILNDNIIVVDNGQMTTLNVNSDLAVYYKTEKHTLSSIANKVSAGDVITVYKNSRGVYDYGIVLANGLEGPYTVRTESWLAGIGMDSTATFMRNGSRVGESSIQQNDIIYYSHTLNTVWAYNKKVTGVYEAAIPSKDNPTSVTISGTTYNIEGAGAFAALSSSGAYNIGDTVTVLMGRDGNSIADVQSTSTKASTVYGYLTETGRKEYTNSGGNRYTSYYAKIVDSSGTELEYPVSADYSSLKNSVVAITVKTTGITVGSKKANVDLSGEVDYENMTIGKNKMSSGISILDVTDSDTYEYSAYAKVYPQNLDKMFITSASVLYYSKNAQGEIDELILKDVTGEAYEYGIVTSASGNKSNSYTYDIGGKSYSFGSSVKYGVYTGNAVKILRNGNSVETMISVPAISTSVSEITNSTVVAGGKEYALGGKVAVYKKVGYNTYLYMSVGELIENSKYYIITAYCDKNSDTGRVRVLVAQQK